MSTMTPLDENALRELHDRLDELQAQLAEQKVWLQEIHGKTVGAGLWPRTKRLASWLWRLRKRVRQARKAKTLVKKIGAKFGIGGAKVVATTVALSAAAATTYVVATRPRGAPPEPRTPTAEHDHDGEHLPVRAPADLATRDAGSAQDASDGPGDHASDGDHMGITDGGAEDGAEDARDHDSESGDAGSASSRSGATRQRPGSGLASAAQLEESLQRTGERRSAPARPGSTSTSPITRLRDQDDRPLAPPAPGPPTPRTSIGSPRQGAAQGELATGARGITRAAQALEKRVRYSSAKSQRRPVRSGAIRPDSRRLGDRDAGASARSLAGDGDGETDETEGETE